MMQTTTIASERREWNTASNGSELTVEDEQSLHRLFKRVYSEGDLSVAEAVVEADVRGHCPGTDTAFQGVSGLKAHAARLRATFPGLTLEIDEIYRVPYGFVASLTLTGRFERAFARVQPSCRIGAAGEEPRGSRVTVGGRVEGTVTDGRLTELAFDWDVRALRAQS